MRCIPHRHLRRKFLRRYPVGKQSGTRRKTTTLEHIVEHQEHSKQKHQSVYKLGAVAAAGYQGTYIGTKSKRHISHSTQQQTYCHMIPGIHPVGNKTVQESRQAIYQAYHCHYHAKAGLRNAILCRQTGNGKRKILSHEIKQCIAYHRGYYCSGLPIFEQLGS